VVRAESAVVTPEPAVVTPEPAVVTSEPAVKVPFPELQVYSADVDTPKAADSLQKGDLSVSDNCSVCKQHVELEDVVYCSECGCVSHLSCWKKHNGCGEEYCNSFEGYIMVVAEGAGAGGDSRYKMHGDGSIELIHHCGAVEQNLIIAGIVFMLLLLIPANFLSFLLTPIAVLGFLGSLIAWRAVERGLREHLMIQGPSNSMSTEKRFFSRRFKGKERFRFKEDIVEVHLKYVNTTIEELESYQRLLGRNKNASIPSVRFECKLLTIEDEYIHLFTEKSRLVNDVVKVAGQIALALDVPLRKMGKGPPLTSQERKRLIGQHVGDGLE
jgi:hypothetical protein